MPHHQVLSQRKSDNLLARLIPVPLIKLANNTYFQLVVSLSLAIVAQGIGLSRTILALDSNISSRQSIARQGKIDNLNRSGVYLANNKALAKPARIVHQVKQGDTVTKIANQYQVSRQQLIELNQIQNSNVIFVDQKLQIPVIVAREEASMPSELVPSSTQKSDVEDPYIANLRAEIEQLRAENRSKAQAPKNSNTSNTSESSATAIATSNSNLRRNTNSEATEDPYIANLRAEIDLLRLENQQQTVEDRSDSASLDSISDSTSEAAAASTPPPSFIATSRDSASSVNVKEDLVEPETVALVLPPLIDEEYLPNAFDGYIWPAQGVLTSGYGWRWGRMHRGIDIGAPIGTPIVAAAAGKVIGAGWHSGYGNLIKLEHLDGSITYYAHLDNFMVTHGQQVKQGEQIAEMGNTGYSTGSHLHFEVRLRGHTAIDPLALLDPR